ncbi:hypothetical protein [Natronomonas amylolytica]|uniref:hypothetical protein n=1 Tax=Natronomonas amylolytica TaxID=3108498 RepID=UPI003008F14C
MEAKTALGIALALAVGLPYVTVGLMEGGRLGLVAFSALFVAAVALVVVSERGNGET